MTIFKTDILAIKKMMVDRGIKNITEFSKISGVSRNVLSNILNGKAQPSTRVMEKLIVSLQIPKEKAGEIFFNIVLHTA